MSNSKVVVINSNEQVDSVLNANTMVVIDFHAVWCMPCKVIAPVYDKLADSLTQPGKLVFLKCDVDAARDVAERYKITAMPTFIILKNKEEIERVQGANAPALRKALDTLANAALAIGQDGSSSATSGAASNSETNTSGVWSGAPVAKGYQDISVEVEKKGLDMLNNNTEFGTVRTLFEETAPSKKSTVKDWIESDTDEQLMIYIPFQSTLKLHSIHITSLPPSSEDEDEEVKRPSTLKLYANRPTIVGFDEAEQMTPTQEVTLAPEDWDKETGTAVINTRFVKFQSVFSLTIFVFEGEEGCEKTRIDRIKLVGEAGEKRDPGKLEKVQQQE